MRFCPSLSQIVVIILENLMDQPSFSKSYIRLKLLKGQDDQTPKLNKNLISLHWTCWDAKTTQYVACACKCECHSQLINKTCLRIVLCSRSLQLNWFKIQHSCHNNSENTIFRYAKAHTTQAFNMMHTIINSLSSQSVWLYPHKQFEHTIWFHHRINTPSLWISSLKLTH